MAVMAVMARAALAALLAVVALLAPLARAADAVPAPAKADSRVDVPLGTTARDLAAEYLPPGVTLDQMLVALLQANPQAFAGGNINRLLAGAQLVMPSAAQLQQVSADKARQTIASQGREFNGSASTPAVAAVPSAEPAAAPAPSPTAVTDPSTTGQPVDSAAGPTDPSTASTPAGGETAPAKTGLLPQLVGHPAVWPATGALLALMAGLAVLRSRQRKNNAASAPVMTHEPAPVNATLHGKLDPRLNAALLAGSTAEATTAPEAVEASKPAPTAFAHFDLDLSLGSESAHPAPATPASAAPTRPDATPPKRVAAAALEFDLSSLSLDLGEPTSPPPPGQKTQKAAP